MCIVLHLIDVTYVALWWSVVDSTLIEVVFLGLDDGGRVEAVEDGVEGASVPRVRHTTAVVTLASQVAQSLVLDVLYECTVNT